MNTLHRFSLGCAALLALAFTGCNQPHSASAIAQNGGLEGAQAAASKPKIQPGSGQVVGKISWVSINESLGYVALTAGPVPDGTYLVALGRMNQPVAVMQAMKSSSGKTQAFFLISGAPAIEDNVIEPDQSHIPLVEHNVSIYGRRASAAAFVGAGTAAPMMVPGQ